MENMSSRRAVPRFKHPPQAEAPPLRSTAPPPLFERETQTLRAAIMADKDSGIKYCCRCGLLLTTSMFGGQFNGAVCYKHRACEDCWWPHGDGGKVRGLRRNEPLPGRDVGLATEGRVKRRCFGCEYGFPEYTAPPVYLSLSSDEE